MDWQSLNPDIILFITFIGAVVGVFGFFQYLYQLRQRSKSLEELLRNEKMKAKDKGQRSVIQIIREVGLTEDEIIQVSFRNPHVGRRVVLDEKGLAEKLLFEYVD